jgi:pyruvate/2-oxoglutarate dehydrogenase complex dihydrolipoamide acyltransferase (E2) component
VDEQAIETEPIAEVRADLAALGLDSTRAIALARRLAAGAATPAVRLLGRIGEAEEGDDEIRRLEQADIAALRRNLKEGTTAATIANAQRAAGQQATVVGLRRRRPRRLWYGLGGVAAALAASVVFFVGLSMNPHPHDARDKGSGVASAPAKTKTNEIGSVPVSMTPEAPYGTVVDRQVRALPAEPADSDAASASRQAAAETDNLQARMQPSGSGPGQLTEQAASAPASPQQSADAEAATRAKSEADENQVTGILGRPESQLVDAPTETATSTLTAPVGEANTEELRGGLLLNQIAPLFGFNRPVVALLIVDPKLVPAGLKQENYPTGDLLARLEDARRLAGGRPIAALVTLQLADRPADAVVIAGRTNELAFRRDVAKTAEQSAASTPGGEAYDIILLDRR